MNEKIRGFKTSDVHVKTEDDGWVNLTLHFDDFVPVISLEQLKKLRLKRLKEMLDRDEERGFGNGYLCAIDEIIEKVSK